MVLHHSTIPPIFSVRKGRESAKACPVLFLRGATILAVSILHFLRDPTFIIFSLMTRVVGNGHLSPRYPATRARSEIVGWVER